MRAARRSSVRAEVARASDGGEASASRARVAALCLGSLVIAACGDAFTLDTTDGGLPGSDASLFDARIDDTGARDTGKPERDAEPHDATFDDGPDVGDGGGKGGSDGGGGSADAGPPVDSGVLCAKPCPSGFTCVAGVCLDRATPDFSASANPPPGNWSYASINGLGEANFTLFAGHTTLATTLSVWDQGGMAVSSTIEPSVFKNLGASAVTYQELTVPAGVMGMYAGAGTIGSVVRWKAPVTGMYDVFGAFVGLDKPASTVTVGVLVNNATTGNSIGTLNMYGNGNTFSFNATAQMLAAGATVDFVCTEITTADDAPGGVSLDARITAD
jgi:hypothetical protein